MAVTLGSGDFRYEVEEGWGRLPGGWSFREVAAVGVDKKDNVYCFSRGQHPIIVFDRDGNFLRSWGEGTYKRAHGITMGPDDTIYLTDDGDHTVRKCTLEGKVLLTLGIPGKAAPYQSGEPFNRCTHVQSLLAPVLQKSPARWKLLVLFRLSSELRRRKDRCDALGSWRGKGGRRGALTRWLRRECRTLRGSAIGARSGDSVTRRRDPDCSLRKRRAPHRFRR